MIPDDIRYSCQIALPGFGLAAQQLLKQARVLIVGIGGLGCPAAQYLTAAGVGTIGLADDDVVSIGNLHRQVLYNPADAGKNKVVIAAERLQAQNTAVNIIQHAIKITSDNIFQILENYDFIIDCTDNFESRYLLNDAAVITHKPLIYSAIYQFEGQVAVWNVRNADGSYSPNYRDIYPEVDASQIPNCAVGGVIPTLAGIIGCMQANEALKLITHTGDLLAGKMLIFDAQTMRSQVIKTGVSTKTNITAIAKTTSANQISFAELRQLDINSYRLVDVRSLQERDLYDIGGEHIPLDELEENLNYFSSDNTYIFYCATGKRSDEAVKIISHLLPSTRALSLAGGLAAE